ncbi:aminotransferase class III-fold pyridoxal phosphate-dependent enzyme [Aquimarina sp. AD1]|uniref:aminotransferase class III-fold pyridoxal phosphate-dependent enzyme n=1 Tax=Aquimarina sp. (strain AD1) TaxID=1714848 RepID=UPI000E492A0E|nr:aminotransferase class III-fold pyridoxal phosphate-dependent enzyme [Aquimarina sp. AD1]AXT56602.1 aminotransferase class III-fold pyridoxal phosphate-dependent enzyme [Aquimarina sp. AD1]RKN33793.1 aminotransferase class III-fold pyridoxal phosphate-dependent enzyme [Aquimarina sp. AD1]
MIDKLLEAEFSFNQPEVKTLNGYDNVNYIVKNNSTKYIFKTYSYDKELFSILQAENELLLHLKGKDVDMFPDPIPFTDGTFIKEIEVDGVKTICRMLSFLDGKFLGDVEATEELFYSLGNFLAEMNLKFQKFDSYVLKARQWEWDIQYAHLNKKYLNDIVDPHNRNVVRYFFQQFEENVIPLLPELRKQVIHNDANEWNILTEKGKVSAVIDFGDLAYSQLINELAIAITYACYDKENPLDWIPFILKGYHSVFPLKDKEIKALYYLIATRLCTSVCNSAHSRKINPENIYATVSEKYAWQMLYKWIRINPIKAENVFRKAIGLLPIEKPLTTEEQVKRRYANISPIVSLSYEEPISMSRSAFQYMYDTDGNTFLDAYNNIPHVGHSHPSVVQAGQKQMARLNTNTRYLYDLLPTYAEKLLSKFPDSLTKVFFVNSGSAASDLAMRMVYAHTGYKKTMVMEHGYHGNTQISIDISDYKFNNPKGQGQKGNILKTPIPDTYRGKYTERNAGELYAEDAVEQIENSSAPIGAFITEPIVGCGGQVPLAAGYLKKVYPAIRRQGGVCISDEVQTGFGRLGDCFWGYESQDVVPDMVIVGKPIANGHPMGAVITTNEIAESFSKGVEFFSSFGGNPVSCAIGLSVLDVIEEEKLQHNAKQVGDYYKFLLCELQNKYDCIGDVRGSGLFLGIEIIKAENSETNKTLAHHIKNELRNKFILISTDGPDDSVLKTKPPLCFTKENAKEVVDTIDEILERYYDKN